MDPQKLNVTDFHRYLLGAVTPRPIAFASSIDKKGIVNLSPFSFFNAFSTNPPILIFSPSRRARDNTTKHTLENVQEVKEVVVNIVTHAIVQQMSLSSTEYAKGVNEFIKSGLTEEPSVKVKPPRVKESPVQFECKVNEIKALGQGGGAGNLVICEILLAHFNEGIMNSNGSIDPNRLDAIGRLGGNWYCRVQGDLLFEIKRPGRKKGIGVDNIPDSIRFSSVLTGNDLGRLATVENLPSQNEIKTMGKEDSINRILNRFDNDKDIISDLHLLAKGYIEKGELTKAWQILLQKI